jgi:hypothetical protein
MIDRHESAISDHRPSLQNLSNRQDSSFQYGDPPKNSNIVNTHEQIMLPYKIRLLLFFFVVVLYLLSKISKSIGNNQQTNPLKDEIYHDPYDTEDVRLFFSTHSNDFNV